MHFGVWSRVCGGNLLWQHAFLQPAQPALLTPVTASIHSAIAATSGNINALSPARRVQARPGTFNRPGRVTGYFARAADRLRPAAAALIGKAIYCSALA